MPDTIRVTVDKSHLITIGERLYGESIELIRELVNNAYDADATEVRVNISEDEIVVEDNGSGMDMEGLEQYFNIGSPEKKINRKSPVFKRDRIGEFGIGKFATLSASSHFEVWTRKDDFCATVIFDKKEWEKEGDRWHLPIIIEKADDSKHNGSKVTLKGLRKKFDLKDVERRIVETVPIKDFNFSVYLNGQKISAKFIPGHRIPFLEGTEFGVVHGEIIVASISGADMREAGIECKVKKVTIKREFFGMEKWKGNVARITGEVHADFVPITSDRSDFIKDSLEYKAFRKIMGVIMERVEKTLEELSDSKESRKTKRALTEVLENVKRALVMNPDLCPETLMPIGEKSGKGNNLAYVPENVKGKKEDNEAVKAEESKTIGDVSPDKERKKSPQVRRLTNTAVIKKLDMGREGVTCVIDHMGPDGPECMTVGNIIYINRDHPLFDKESQNRNTYTLHISRLLTQEISMMKDPHNPRQAFERQSKLLKDALVSEIL
ncbi:MAG: ATP-binding protein [Candidatus Omnitrophica bacterium]|nr:ATP-binding protein [Candidatus Omnitrophota bacterium]